jgi:hypothetical protein
MKRYNKEQLLELTNGGEDVYLAYLDLESDGNGGYKHSLNPCYEDTKPSLMVKYDADRFRHHDYGGSPDGKEYKGDCFDFVAQLMDLDIEKDFGKIMEIIAEKLEIQLQVEHEINDYSALSLYGYELDYADDKELLEFFKPYGVTHDILRKYNVRSIRGYKQLKDGNVKYTRMPNLVIGYEQSRFVKVYCPSPKRFWFLGGKEKEFVFGYQQIVRRAAKSPSKKIGDTIVIVGGEKDVLTSTALGLDAVSLNSETANIPKWFVEVLEMYERVIIVYDNDTTGREWAAKLNQMYRDRLNIFIYNLPDELQQRGGKDISDYVKLDLSKERLLNEIAAVGKTAIVKDLYPSADVNEPTRPIIAEDKAVYKQEDNDDSFLPEEIFENLPELLKIATEEFTDRREKDLILLSCLGVLSSLFPSVKGVHGGMKVGANLFLLVSAPAASGKGAINWSQSLGGAIEKHLNEKYHSEYKKFQSEMSIYKKERRNNPDMIEPVEPIKQSLFMPANSSVSKIINLIGANKNFGILFETEADTLANALNSEWGDFSSVLRSVFHHERISKGRMADGEDVNIEKPHLSVILSGTPKQIKNVIGSVENGFFSRFIFYDFVSEPKWVNQFISKDNSREELFKELGEYLAEIWIRHQNQDDTNIYLSEKQIENLNSYFDKKFIELLERYGDEIAASVKRGGLVCYRLAMILTALKYLETSKVLPAEIEVSDNEFKISLSIIDTVLNNLESVFSRLQNSAITKKMNNQQRQVYEAISSECSRQEYDSIVSGMKINIKTGEKYLKDYIKMGAMQRIKHGYYRKVA